jgi:hypothetical protein
MHAYTDLSFWHQPVELVMPLWVAMSVHGVLCLGLRHPDTRGLANRAATVRAVRQLGDLLVAKGAITRARLRQLEQVEADAGGLSPDEPGWTGGEGPG